MDVAELVTQELTGDLTRREHAMLAFEGQWWRYPGAKEAAIHELFELSPSRYYQVLNSLIDKREALNAYPMLVKRLRKLRAGRQQSRGTFRMNGDLP